MKWTQLKPILFVIALLSGALLFHTLFISNGWTEREKLRTALFSVELENKEIQNEIAKLRSQIDAIRRRPAVQERVIRDELGFIKPKEIILELGHNN